MLDTEQLVAQHDGSLQKKKVEIGGIENRGFKELREKAAKVAPGLVLEGRVKKPNSPKGDQQRSKGPPTSRLRSR